ncbi:hypothetical protein B0T14DRAFT_571139 [Immersiella caudata]|uniref:Uncharacterized protein n=1 Tax=Immersiella caudata TaxID=314043 RepID=A0AA39U2P5_9PEZI|nr:hypothetical protein B0T14DRAFT_571139 [Immersiella caudata]
MEQPCASTLVQPWREWYKPVDGPLGARMIIPYMAAGNGGGAGGDGPPPEKPESEDKKPEEELK